MATETPDELPFEDGGVTGENVDLTKVESTYDANKMQVLEGLAAVRRHPAMYIGGKDAKGLHHLFVEVTDNAIDEAMAGYCTRVDVVLHADGSLSVRDNG